MTTPTLSPRELQVLAGMARDLSNEEIARELSLGTATVKTHVGRLLRKLGVKGRAGAVAAGYRLGLLTGASSLVAVCDAAEVLAAVHRRGHPQLRLGCSLCAAVGVIRAARVASNREDAA